MENTNHPFLLTSTGNRPRIFQKEGYSPLPGKKQGKGPLPPAAGGVSRRGEPTAISNQTFPQACLLRGPEGKGRNGGMFPFAGHPLTLACGTVRFFFPDGPYFVFHDGLSDNCRGAAEKPSSDGWPSHHSRRRYR